MKDGTAGVGERIKALRVERGMTQDALATACGVSRSAVAQWETGRAGPKAGGAAHLSQVASVLGTSVEVLLHGAASRGAAEAASGDELALLRLYRELPPADRAALLRLARRFARPGPRG